MRRAGAAASTAARHCHHVDVRQEREAAAPRAAAADRDRAVAMP
jgi:hypothetical protein